MTETEEDITPEEFEAETEEVSETEEAAGQRARECFKMIRDACQHFTCDIIPKIGDVVPVGRDGATVQISAGFAVVPRPLA